MHDCNQELEQRYPRHAQALDGEKWTCSCGKKYEHVCDEAYGCAWVPMIRPVRDESEKKERRKKVQAEFERLDIFKRKRRRR